MSAGRDAELTQLKNFEKGSGSVRSCLEGPVLGPGKRDRPERRPMSSIGKAGIGRIGHPLEPGGSRGRVGGPISPTC